MDNLNFKDLNFMAPNGKIVEDNSTYMEVIQNNTDIEDKLEIGDIIKLKGVDNEIEVLYIDYNIPNIGIVDYAGKYVDDDSNELVLFNQKDIALLVGKKKNNVR